MKFWDRKTLDIETVISNDEVISKFFKSEFYEKWYVDHFGIERAFRHFILLKEGLNSIHLDDEDFCEILDTLKLNESQKEPMDL